MPYNNNLYNCKFFTILKSHQIKSNVGFWREGKTILYGEEPLGAEKRTKNLNPLMTPSPGIEPGTHWLKASALPIAPTLLPSHAFCKQIFGKQKLTSNGTCKIQLLNIQIKKIYHRTGTLIMSKSFNFLNSLLLILPLQIMILIVTVDQMDHVTKLLFSNCQLIWVLNSLLSSNSIIGGPGMQTSSTHWGCRRCSCPLSPPPPSLSLSLQACRYQHS